MLAAFKDFFKAMTTDECACGPTCRCGENCACTPEAKCSPACECVAI
jgi:hypothetical protein